MLHVKRLVPVLVTAPATALFTLAEAKQAIKREDIADDDAHIKDLVLLATAKLDGPKGDLGRALIEQEWSEEFDEFPLGERFEVNLAPAISITKIEYYDSVNVLQTFNAANYNLHNAPEMSYARLATDAAWPVVFDRDDAVKITYKAGYGAAATDVPIEIRRAAKLLVGHYDRFRQPLISGTNVAPVPNTYDALIAKFKRPIFHDKFQNL